MGLFAADVSNEWSASEISTARSLSFRAERARSARDGEESHGVPVHWIGLACWSNERGLVWNVDLTSVSPGSHGDGEPREVLRLKTFGGLSLEGDERPLTGAAAQRRRLVLLAALAAAGQKGMSRDALVGLLWPEVDEARARAALSQALYALKRDTGEDALVLGHDLLTLKGDVLRSDVSEFEHAIARGDFLAAAHLYTGPFLAGVFISEAPDFEHWVDGVRLRLSQGAEHALEALATDAERNQDFAAASHWWHRLLELDAVKTRAVLGLMEALVALGDNAAALKTAERYAGRVREDLDGEPNASIMAYASSLRGTPSRLPVFADEMIGRGRELGVATSLMERPDVSLLTLTGAGGTGKTRLAIQVARALEPRMDRVWFVDLSALRDSAAVMPAVAFACGIEQEPGCDPVDAIAASLAGRGVLIVLDNFEQVVDAAEAVARLVNAAPNAKLLVTSRMRLGIRAEHEFFVAPLALAEDPTDIGALRANSAVRLFLRRAAAANPSLTVDDDTLRAAARICARVDGLPLAIELAAARCRLLSPLTIATRLESGLDLVSGGGRDMPARQQTIRETVAWSVALLSESERRVFIRFAAFAGGASIAAAEWACAGANDSTSTLDALTALVDASLLIREPAQRDDPRLRMLETVREFAMDALTRGSEKHAILGRHAEWYQRLATQLEPSLTGETQQDALTTLARDHANFGAALDWMVEGVNAEGALALAAALWRYWLVRGHFEEGRRWLARVLEMPASQAPALDRLRADAMTGAGTLAQNNGAVAAAKEHFEAVLAIRRAHDDTVGIARALADLGWIAWRQCDFPNARQLSSECLTLAEEVGATRVAALALTNLGATALFEGNFHEACEALERSSARRRRVADRRGVAFSDTFLAWTRCRMGDVSDAIALLERAEETLDDVGDRRLIYFAREIKAHAFLRRGNAARAAEILEINGLRRFGDRWGVAHGLALASWASRLLGLNDRAESLGKESLQLRRAEGDRYGEAESLALLAAAASARGDEVTTFALLQQSRGIRQAIGDRAGVAECDAELARIAAHA
jgi:predicted ATPase/DNA-binding SARP family transcriptional activator